ncbi:MAG TPA: radical SAM protein [Blastocatellia bacterium]|nr:radical SAM protein [Blastocatellia bacterium]
MNEGTDSISKVRQFVRLIKSTKREKRLGTLILFVTSRCNSFCKTCFYWDELNQPGDLTLEQIENVSRTMPPITDLWLSGGEPSLRKDIVQVIDTFVVHNQVSRIIIPTNGLAAARIYRIVDETLGRHDAVDLYLNVALDGFGETHDHIRGIPHHWQKTLSCIESLYPLKQKYGDRFRLNANTVICAANYGEVEKLADFAWRTLKLDGHYFNIIRGETPSGEAIKQVPSAVLPALYARAGELTKRYGDRMFASDDSITRFVKNIAYVGSIMTHYRTEHANLQGPSEWPMACTAGETIAVIDYNGDVRACELRERFATLSDYDYDFGALWADHSRLRELEAIDGGNACWCTHVCFIHESLRNSRRALLYEVPKNYILRRSW